jgi:endonuclease/exonuclease/phosphatase family metal-dependent hydrolase
METTLWTRRGQWVSRTLTILVMTMAIGRVGGHPALAEDDHRTITVFTANMDAGTDFKFLAAATDPNQFLAAVAATYAEVVAGKPDERAAGLAREIAAAQPTLVALQEATLWRTGPLFAPPAGTVAYDQLQSLLDALAADGQHYAAVAISTNQDVETPDLAIGQDVRATDRDVLLARTDLPDADLKLSNVLQHHFATFLTVPTPVGPIADPRGWIAADVTVRGKTFRFVTTHLESFAAVQVAQGNELLQGPAATGLPVVLAGDFNSAAAGGPDQTLTYGNMIAAGFTDDWAQVNPQDQGFTWPLHGEDPLTVASTPTERTDLVISRGDIEPTEAHLTGNSTSDLTPSGLWPSDHAAVVATFQIP